MCTCIVGCTLVWGGVGEAWVENTLFASDAAHFAASLRELDWEYENQGYNEAEKEASCQRKAKSRHLCTQLRVELGLGPCEHRLEDTLRDVLLVEPDEQLAKSAVVGSAIVIDEDTFDLGIPPSALEKHRPPLVRCCGVCGSRRRLARWPRLLWTCLELLHSDIVSEHVFLTTGFCHRFTVLRSRSEVDSRNNHYSPR